MGCSEGDRTRRAGPRYAATAPEPVRDGVGQVVVLRTGSMNGVGVQTERLQVGA